MTQEHSVNNYQAQRWLLHKLTCLNAYSPRNTALSIICKSYHLTLKVNVKEGGKRYHPFSISPS